MCKEFDVIVAGGTVHRQGSVLKLERVAQNVPSVRHKIAVPTGAARRQIGGLARSPRTVSSLRVVPRREDR